MKGKKRNYPGYRLAWITMFLGAWIATLYAVHVNASNGLPYHKSYVQVQGGQQGWPEQADQQQPTLEQPLVAIRHWSSTSLTAPPQTQFLSRETPEQNRHSEKRHKRTLVSQAIVPDFSLEPLRISYCQHAYSLFLPPGCPQQVRGSFSLRGPPVLY